MQEMERRRRLTARVRDHVPDQLCPGIFRLRARGAGAAVPAADERGFAVEALHVRGDDVLLERVGGCAGEAACCALHVVCLPEAGLDFFGRFAQRFDFVVMRSVGDGVIMLILALRIQSTLFLLLLLGF